ncbi:MAG: hypothetical protein KIS85_08545 [Anaerolineales bacterium]|nr:hypothetical protein [Anaerolineales bacterium]
MTKALSLWDDRLLFTSISFRYGEKLDQNTFARLKGAKLGDLIGKRRYSDIAPTIVKYYLQHMYRPLGEFLLERKENYDIFYKQFLNSYGDMEYCNFSIETKQVMDKKGLYLYVVNEEIIYIGSCVSSFRQRINSGYGRISPKNCYRDGQATNCKINSQLAKTNGDFELYICPRTNNEEILSLEKVLIQRYLPKWNYTSALKTSHQLNIE